MIEVRAQTLIKKDDEITTRYFDPWVGQPKRQLTIEKSWRFLCNCKRCQNPTDLATYFSAIKCQYCTEKSSSLSSTDDSGCKVIRHNTSKGDGYILPKDLQTLETSWQCVSCGQEKCLSEIEHVLSSINPIIEEIKSQILCVMAKEVSKLVMYITSSVNLLEKYFHRNHFLIFHYKIWILELSIPEFASTDNATESQNDENHKLHVLHEISFLELKMKYHADVLRIVEMLDSGLTIARAEHYKRMARCRIGLSQLKMSIDPHDDDTKLQQIPQIEIAMSEFKQSALTYNYPEQD